MNELVREFRDFFVSLKLTVVLLALGMLLVFVGTIDQVNLGIWAAQEKYFRSFFVMFPAKSIPVLSSFMPPNAPVPVLPGGYLIGGLLLINLVAAHVYRFKRSWRKAGIELTHFGLILLLIGELFTGLWQDDFAMRLTEGETKNYSESHRDNELVIADTTDAKFDEVVAIPEHMLAQRKEVQHPKLPFRVIVRDYYPNMTLRSRLPAGHPTSTTTLPPTPANRGHGTSVTAAPLPITYKQDERNLPGGYIELVGAKESLGTWLVGVEFALRPEDFVPQTLEYEGRTYTIGMRFKREYKPFSLTLLDFRHDRYAGTELPKNFSSRLRLTTPDGRDDREVLIYMNNPLRYAGLTFYQSGYEGEQTTVLQVVRNPSWLIPYIACALMTLGLLVQFGIHLSGFINRRRATLAVKPA